MQVERHREEATAPGLSAWRNRTERRRRARPDGGTKPVDLGYLARFTLGSRDLEQEVLGLFVTHGPRYLDLLKTASNAKAWHDAAHTLKGAARGIGAWRIARLSETAERLNFETEPDRRAFALDSLGEALDEALGYIAVLRREM